MGLNVEDEADMGLAGLALVMRVVVGDEGEEREEQGEEVEEVEAASLGMTVKFLWDSEMSGLRRSTAIASS